MAHQNDPSRVWPRQIACIHPRRRCTRQGIPAGTEGVLTSDREIWRHLTYRHCTPAQMSTLPNPLSPSCNELWQPLDDFGSEKYLIHKTHVEQINQTTQI